MTENDEIFILVSVSPDCHEPVSAAADKYESPGSQEAQEPRPHVVRVPGQRPPVLSLGPHPEPGLGEAGQPPVAGGCGGAVHQDLPDLVSPADNWPRRLSPHYHDLGSGKNLQMVKME